MVISCHLVKALRTKKDYVLQQKDGTVVFADLNLTMEIGDTVSDSQMQRVWAYLTVKQLLDKE